MAHRLRPYVDTIVGGAAVGIARVVGGSCRASQRRVPANGEVLGRLGDQLGAQQYAPPPDTHAEPQPPPTGRLARWHARWTKADAADLS